MLKASLVILPQKFTNCNSCFRADNPLSQKNQRDILAPVISETSLPWLFCHKKLLIAIVVFVRITLVLGKLV